MNKATVAAAFLILLPSVSSGQVTLKVNKWAKKDVPMIQTALTWAAAFEKVEPKGTITVWKTFKVEALARWCGVRTTSGAVGCTVKTPDVLVIFYRGDLKTKMMGEVLKHEMRHAVRTLAGKKMNWDKHKGHDSTFVR